MFNSMIIPVISIVGKSNSGKTSLLVKIIRNLSKKGYRIGTIKHYNHKFEIDYPGKDSYRHFHAGSDATIIVSPEKLALVKRLSKPLFLNSIIKNFFQGFDLVITEGFKQEHKPKIEVIRKAISKVPICLPQGDNLVVLITDIFIAGYTQPQFKPNEINKIVQFIERKFL